MSCGVGHRHGSDPALLWLCRRPTATAPIRPLAWEHPNAMGVALEKTKRQKKKKYKDQTIFNSEQLYKEENLIIMLGWAVNT